MLFFPGILLFLTNKFTFEIILDFLCDICQQKQASSFKCTTKVILKYEATLKISIYSNG